MWFAAPRKLNDKYDIRTKLRFDFSQLDHPKFLQKLKDMHEITHSGTIFSERELRIISERTLLKIKEDPLAFFEKNYSDIRESDTYDTFGIFSTATNGLIERMWFDYANDYTGFAVGFNTVELSRELFCSQNIVRYSNEIPIYDLLTTRHDTDVSPYYLKTKDWEYESEYRFITMGVKSDKERSKTYPVNSVVEFLIGMKFPENLKSDFITEVRKFFPMKIPIFQVSKKKSEDGLEKLKIN